MVGIRGCVMGNLGGILGILGGVVAILGGEGRKLGLWIDLGCGMGEMVLSLGDKGKRVPDLSLDKGKREPVGEEEGYMEEVIVPEVLHLQQQRLLRCTFLCFGVFNLYQEKVFHLSVLKKYRIKTKVLESILAVLLYVEHSFWFCL